MEKINTPIMALIETRKKYIKDLESLPEWDRRTRQVLRWHKDELAELEKMLPTEREVIEKAFQDGMNNIVPHSHEWIESESEYEYYTTETIDLIDYFTQTFKSYE